MASSAAVLPEPRSAGLRGLRMAFGGFRGSAGFEDQVGTLRWPAVGRGRLGLELGITNGAATATAGSTAHAGAALGVALCGSPALSSGDAALEGGGAAGMGCRWGTRHSSSARPCLQSGSFCAAGQLQASLQPSGWKCTLSTYCSGLLTLWHLADSVPPSSVTAKLLRHPARSTSMRALPRPRLLVSENCRLQLTYVLQSGVATLSTQSLKQEQVHLFKVCSTIACRCKGQNEKHIGKACKPLAYPLGSLVVVKALTGK